MRIYGVVAEFNPFHNGHAHLLSSVKESQDDGVVCVMSGNFVQRGEPSVISKFARTKAALALGADLVIELPLPYSIGSAMYFANGAIQLLKGLGVVDTLCFGSECGDIEKLKNAVNILNNPDFPKAMKKNLNTGISYAAARFSAAQSLAEADDLSVLTTPNDTLGVEYISAAENIGADFDYKVIKRVGTEHDSDEPAEGFCSASYIRKMLNEKPHLIKKYMPYESYKILIEELNAGRIADYSLLDRAIVAHLRTITPEQLKKVPDVSEGIENRIILAANKFSTVEEIVEAVKSKRYTYARLKRIILASFLGVTSGLRQRKVPYIRVLGMNEKGAEILSLAKSKSSLFVVGSLKDAERIDDNTAIYTTLEAKATDIYSLALPKPNVGKIDYTTKFYKTF